MFNVGGGEMLAILLLALLVLGPERLPKAMGEVGRFVGQLRRMSSGFQDEIKKAMDAANVTAPDGDAPFAPGEEVLPALAPGVEDEVKVVHDRDAARSAADDADIDTDHSTGHDADAAGDRVEAAPPPATDDTAEGEASVTPLRPSRHDGTRATG